MTESQEQRQEADIDPALGAAGDESVEGEAVEAPRDVAAATADGPGAAEEDEAGDASGQSEASDDGEPVVPPTPEEIAEVGREFVQGLVAAIGIDAQVTGTTEDDTAFIDVAGEDLGALIGRRGQTLDALQELARTAVQRKLRSRVRLIVDVEAYRARRKASLAEYARAIAERAKERGTEIELEPMTAYERKVVHDAVAEIDGASSFSEGEEPNRKVVVRGE